MTFYLEYSLLTLTLSRQTVEFLTVTRILNYNYAINATVKSTKLCQWFDKMFYMCCATHVIKIATFKKVHLHLD